jgi:hypothetical protein
MSVFTRMPVGIPGDAIARIQLVLQYTLDNTTHVPQESDESD